ncbi:hypothetical protein KEM48_005715 [Puccinia striiformis f. sp. tritici PST-130]|nr:hypothetical protein KEM48_005715 [Puccinia striiformis f. sp. tritici PST-130]
MHSTTLVIALVGLCSYMPLAMGATSTGAGMTPTPGNAPPTSKDLSKDASATPKDASAIPKDDTKDSTTTPAKDGTKDKDASKDGSKDGTTPSDGSATSGSPSGAPKMVMGDMSSATEKDGKPGPPTEDTPPKTDTPKTPSGAPQPPLPVTTTRPRALLRCLEMLLSSPDSSQSLLPLSWFKPVDPLVSPFHHPSRCII